MAASDLIKAAQRNWSKPSGLAFAIVAVLVCASLALPVLPNKVVTLVSCLVVVLLLIHWLFRQRLKRCPKGKFGFVVAISVDDIETYRIFERDFIQNLQGLLSAGNLKDHIWVYYVPQFHLPNVLTEDQAINLRTKIRAGFVLYGQVRTRDEDVSKHYLDLRGVVGHAQTSEQNKRHLRAEFTELLPARVVAPKSAELPTFEMTSSLSSMVAKYITGIAIFLSGHLDYAEAMYADALSQAKQNSDYEVAKKILERIPIRLAEISLTRARSFYDLWKSSRSEDFLLQMGEILNSAPEAAHDIPEWKVLKAISLVVEAGTDLDSIENLVKQTPNEDPVTQMNLAFFDIVRGDLRAATRHYRKASDLDVQMDTIEEVMSFLEWYQEYRSECTAKISFALGYISYYLLRDVALSQEFFDKFGKSRADEFAEEDVLTIKWLAELKAN